MYLNLKQNFEFELAREHGQIGDNLEKALGYLGLICNISSCFVLALVLRFISKVNKLVISSSNPADGEKGINKLVTIAHISLILGFSILSILHFNCQDKFSKKTYNRV